LKFKRRDSIQNLVSKYKNCQSVNERHNKFEAKPARLQLLVLSNDTMLRYYSNAER